MSIRGAGGSCLPKLTHYWLQLQLTYKHESGINLHIQLSVKIPNYLFKVLLKSTLVIRWQLSCQSVHSDVLYVNFYRLSFLVTSPFCLEWKQELHCSSAVLTQEYTQYILIWIVYIFYINRQVMASSERKKNLSSQF